jgi:hypothetical protein
LRQTALKFSPNKLASLSAAELLESAQKLVKAGVEFPQQMKMEIVRWYARDSWDSITDPKVSDERLDVGIRELLERFLPWAAADQADFDFGAPRLAQVGLTEGQMVEAMVQECWAAHVVTWFVDADAAQDRKVQRWCELLLQSWVLTEEDDVSNGVAEQLLTIRRLCKVLTFLLDPIVKADTDPNIVQDVEVLERSALLTTAGVDLFVLVGQAIQGAASWRARLGGLSKVAKHLETGLGVLTKSLQELHAAAHGGPCKRLTDQLLRMCDELVEFRALLKGGQLDSYEPKWRRSARRLPTSSSTSCRRTTVGRRSAWTASRRSTCCWSRWLASCLATRSGSGC